MIKVILYIAISQDGFIADEQGGVGWLDKYSNGNIDCGYHDFYASIDALAFGKNTYNQVLTFGPWPYPDKKSYIFGDQQMIIEQKDAELVLDDILTFLQQLEAAGIKRLWLMGGAQLVDSFYKLGSIDEYILTIMPDLLGAGIALPAPIFKAENLRLVETIDFPDSGIVQKYYQNR